MPAKKRNKTLLDCTLEEIAEITKSRVIGNPKHKITGISDLENAQSNEASFLANPRYLGLMKQSKAGVVFIDQEDLAVQGRNFLLNKDPSKAFQVLIERAYLAKKHSFEGIHPSAFIHPSAKLAPSVIVGPQAVIDEGVEIAENSYIGPQTYVGLETAIGSDCYLHPQSVVRERCMLANRVILQPGAIVGSCGFGYVQEGARRQKLEQLGRVIIEDDVEIGANTCIDRARFKNTIIKKGTKIDNLVQIAHGVELGDDNCIVAQSGIAGSTKTASRVLFAAQSGCAGHLQISDDVILVARAGVTKSIENPGTYAGMPAKPIKQHNRHQVQLRQIETHLQKIKELEEKVRVLESRG